MDEELCEMQLHETIMSNRQLSGKLMRSALNLSTGG
jgi:hypothetical protein